ncbi:MAG TPA: metalloregulator ArsR/SmtB family transcription factor [Ktedonobacterales bacterium]|jgi:DNA-binding transcriptional ArsR family regulator
MPTRVKSATELKAKLFRGFADLSRLSILEALRNGPLTVGAIVEQTGLSQSNVSNHLRCLSDCDLVIAEAQGRYTRYQLSDPRVGTLLTLAEELMRDVARGIYDCTRYEEEEGTAHE